MTSIYGFALVYQNGIANVFELRSLGPKRIMQADYNSCEACCLGIQACEEKVQVFHCDVEGDIGTPEMSTKWKPGTGHLFNRKGL